MKIRELITVFGFQLDERSMSRNETVTQRFIRDSERRFGSMSNAITRGMNRSFDSVASHGARAFMSLESRWSKMRSTIARGVTATFKFHGIGEAEKRISNLNRSMLRTVGMVTGGVGLAGGAYATGKRTLTEGGQYETQMAMLETTFGKKHYQSLYDQSIGFAGRTPTNTKDVLDFMMTFQNMGINVAENGKLNERMLEGFGNLAATSPRIREFKNLQESLLSIMIGRGEMVDNFAGLLGKAENGGLTITDAKTQQKHFFDMEEDPRARQKIFDFLINRGFEQGRAGAMMKLGQTLPGKQAQAQDSISRSFVNLYKPLQGNVHSAMTSIMGFLERMEPMATKIGEGLSEWIKNDLPGYLEKTQKVLPYVVGGLGLMYAHMLGIKTMGFARAVYQGATALQAMGVSGAIAAGGMAAVPLLVGLTTAGIGLLTADIIYFATTGESYLLSFTEKWPGLHDKIRYAYNLTIELAKQANQGFKSMGELVGMYLPPLLDGLRLGFERTLTPARVTLDIIVGLWKAGGDAVEGFKRAFESLMTWIRTEFPFLEKVGNTIARFFGSFEGGHGPNRDRGLTSYSGNASNRILQAGLDFTAGAPRSSMADRWALGQSKQDGMSVKKLFIDGVACAISAEKIVANAGGSQALLNQMTPSVSQTYNNLINSGMAELVPASQLKGGELFFHKNLGHMGVVGPDGKKLIHAANSRGREIGMGQRLTQTGNYLGEGGYYLRIKDQHLQSVSMPSPNRAAGGSGSATIPQQFVFNGPANPQQVSNAARSGTEQALSNSALGLQQMSYKP